jgi:excinuclease ABC subunit C
VAPFAFDPTRYPSGPGCYLMRDAAGAVMYVGKAKNLRRRLASHFRDVPRSGRRSRLMAAVADVELILVSNETEALILEHNLIKRHKPWANRVLLDDDEGYFYMALTAEELPRLVPYRKHRINKQLERGGTVTQVARCFGPYVNRRFRDALLGYAADQFRLRTCAPLPKAVCLRFHMGVCGGVCERLVSALEYASAVDQAVAFLSRRNADLIRHMRQQMAEYAEQLQFERANWTKHHIELLQGALEPQLVEREVRHDQDVVHFSDSSALVMQVRRGVLSGCALYMLSGQTTDQFVLAHYAGDCPSEIIVNESADRRGLEQRLAAANRHRVRVSVHGAGRRSADRLMKLCAMNHAYRAFAVEHTSASSAPSSRSSS